MDNLQEKILEILIQTNKLNQDLTQMNNEVFKELRKWRNIVVIIVVTMCLIILALVGKV